MGPIPAWLIAEAIGAALSLFGKKKSADARSKGQKSVWDQNQAGKVARNNLTSSIMQGWGLDPAGMMGGDAYANLTQMQPYPGSGFSMLGEGLQTVGGGVSSIAPYLSLQEIQKEQERQRQAMSGGASALSQPTVDPASAIGNPAPGSSVRPTGGTSSGTQAAWEEWMKMLRSGNPGDQPGPRY